VPRLLLCGRVIFSADLDSLL
jgi:hypothetical protein